MFTNPAQGSRRTPPRLRTLLIVLAATLLAGATSSAPPTHANTATRIFLPQLVSAGTPLQTEEQRLLAEEVVRLTNEERALAGCAELTINQDLIEAAQAHSADMAEQDYFDHTGSDGSDFVARVVAAGYVGAPGGENIAAGYVAPADVIAGWLNSAGHRANIRNCAYTTIGVGYAYDADSTYERYWTQVFGL